MHELLLRRLSQYIELSSEERNGITKLCSSIPRYVGARRLLIDEGEELYSIPYLLRGWACSYKVLEDGRCQILSFFLPGDLWDFGAPAGSRMATALRTIKDSILIDIPRDDFADLVARHPRLGEAFRWSGMVTDEISRERIVSLGQRTSRERCAHMICEIFWRLRAIGEVDGSSMELPLTQEEVGHTIGVSTVHANRVLQDLRNDNLIRQFRKGLQILDLAKLQRLAIFNPNFLHLQTKSAALRAPVKRPGVGAPLLLGQDGNVLRMSNVAV